MNEHSSFLKRNGASLGSILDASLPPLPKITLPLLQELTILIATGQVSSFLDGRSRRAWLKMCARYPPRLRAVWTAAEWERRAGDLKWTDSGTGRRLYAIHRALGRRQDYPYLTATRGWGEQRWRSLLRRAGCGPDVAGSITSLILGRNEMPGGPRAHQVYQRLGYKCDRQGRPSGSRVLPRDVPVLKWKLQQLAAVRCTPEISPGGSVCKTCPVRAFCQAYRKTRIEILDGRPRFADLYAGPGGMSLGMKAAGMRLVLAAERERHAADTLYLNHPEASDGVVLCRSVKSVLANRGLVAELKGVDVLIGGPPCQAWSIVRRHSRADRNNPTRRLVGEFVRACRLISPKLAVMENVPGLRNAGNGTAFRRILRSFEQAGFAVGYLELNAVDFGVPQNRRRVFFFAVNRRRNRDAEEVLRLLVSACKRRAKKGTSSNVQDALSGLPKLAPGEGGLALRKNRRGPRSRYARSLAGGGPMVHNHQSRPHNREDLAIFNGLHWGEVAWQYEKRRPGSIRYSLDSFSDKYRKIHPRRPSPTIPSHLHRDSNSFVHPFEGRGITPREAARLQSFPDDYVFLGGFGPSFIQIGNAVPPVLAEKIARPILSLVA